MKEKLNRIKENLWKNKYILLAFVVLWVGLIVFSLSHYRTTMGMEAIGTNVSDHVTELYEGITVEQDLPVLDDARTINIRFATYARRNNEGNVNIRVTGKQSGTVYMDRQVPTSQIVDNAFLSLDLKEPLDLQKDTEIAIVISSAAERGKGVGVYYTDRDILEGGMMSVNGRAMDGSDVTVKLQIPNEAYDHFSRVIIIWSIVVFSILIVLLAAEVSPQVWYAATVLLVGMIFIAVITPMSVPDEQFHYESAYQIISKLFGEDHTQIDIAYRNYSHFRGHENSALAYLRLIEQFDRPMELKEEFGTVAVDIDEMRYVGYFVPQSVGVLIGRVFKMNFLKTFYLGRFTNLLFYTFCVFWAVRKTPIHKNLFGLLACMPILLQQGSSYSYDCSINGLTLILLAYFLKWYCSEETVSRKEIIAVVAVTFFLAPAKFVYGLFTAIFLFIPKKRFNGGRNKAIAMLLILSPVIYQLSYILIPQITTLIKRAWHAYGPTTSDVKVYSAGMHLDLKTFLPEEDFDPPAGKINYTIGYIVDRPLYTLQLIYRTIRYSIKRWFYDALGMTLSGETMLLPIRIVHTMVIVTLLSSLIKEEHHLSVFIKFIMLGVCIAIGLMIVLGFLLSETKKTDPMIQGIQGRYLSPLLPYFFLLFGNRKIALPKQTGKYLNYVHLLVLFEVILYILSFTFVNY